MALGSLLNMAVTGAFLIAVILEGGDAYAGLALASSLEGAEEVGLLYLNSPINLIKSSLRRLINNARFDFEDKDFTAMAVHGRGHVGA